MPLDGVKSPIKADTSHQVGLNRTEQDKSYER